MRDRPSHNLSGLDIDLARRIEEVCRRFKNQSRQGRRARIEDYLSEVPEVGRSALRAELDALARELCRSEEAGARSELPAPSTIAGAATIAPGPPPTPLVPGAAPSSPHEEATVPPSRPPRSGPAEPNRRDGCPGAGR